MQIILQDIILFGYHGVHPLENELGTSFNIDIKIDVEEVQILSLEDTVDYEKVYVLLKAEFEKTEKLLEVLADRIILSICNHFKHISQVEVTIMKINPPIPSFQGSVGVKKIKKLK